MNDTMVRTTKIVCQCGGEIGRPVPTHCPHCGARIVGFRTSLISTLIPPLVVGVLFAALVAVVVVLLR